MRFVLSVKDLIIIWLMASLLNMSSNRLLNLRPYDAEIEYLMSDGSAYINTGVRGKCNFVIQAGIPRTGTNVICIFGSRRNYHDNSFLIFWGQDERDNEEKGVIRMDYANKTFLFPSRSENDVVLTYNGTTLSDGMQTLAISGGGTLTPINSHCLFAVNSNGSIIKALDGTYIRYAKIGNLDLIPVRVGQVGYMYDKVSGQLFGNQGTGSFILGADKN